MAGLGRDWPLMARKSFSTQSTAANHNYIIYMIYNLWRYMANHKKMQNPVVKLVSFERDELAAFEQALPKGISLAEALREIIKQKNETGTQDRSPVRVWYGSSNNESQLCAKSIMELLGRFIEWVRGNCDKEEELMLLSLPSANLQRLVAGKYLTVQHQRIKGEQLKPLVR
jgi:hypothetical protein